MGCVGWQYLAQLDGEAATDAAALAEAAHAQARLKHALAAQAVTSARYTACMLGLQRWLQARAWRDSCSARQLRRLDAHVRPFARATLRKDQRRLIKRGKRLLLHTQAAPPGAHRGQERRAMRRNFLTSLFGAGRASVRGAAVGAAGGTGLAQTTCRWPTGAAGIAEVQAGQADQSAQGDRYGCTRLRARLLAARAQTQGSDGRMHKAWRRFKAVRLPA